MTAPRAAGRGKTRELNAIELAVLEALAACPMSFTPLFTAVNRRLGRISFRAVERAVQYLRRHDRVVLLPREKGFRTYAEWALREASDA